MALAALPLSCLAGEGTNTPKALARVPIQEAFGWKLGDDLPLRYRTNGEIAFFDSSQRAEYGKDIQLGIVGGKKIASITLIADSGLTEKLRAGVERVYGPAPKNEGGANIIQTWTNGGRRITLDEERASVYLSFADDALVEEWSAEWKVWNEEENALNAKKLPLSSESMALQKAAQTSALAAKKAELAARALESDRAAADRGDVYAELQMGKRYRDGDGVEKDPARARDWFSKAAAQGNTEAARDLDALAR